MEIIKKHIWKENVDNTISNGGCPDTGLLITPNPGVAYVQATDHVYFNNVCLPQHGGGPREDVLNVVNGGFEDGEK